MARKLFRTQVRFFIPQCSHIHHITIKNNGAFITKELTRCCSRTIALSSTENVNEFQAACWKLCLKIPRWHFKLMALSCCRCNKQLLLQVTKCEYIMHSGSRDAAAVLNQWPSFCLLMTNTVLATAHKSQWGKDDAKSSFYSEIDVRTAYLKKGRKSMIKKSVFRIFTVRLVRRFGSLKLW